MQPLDISYWLHPATIKKCEVENMLETVGTLRTFDVRSITQ